MHLSPFRKGPGCSLPASWSKKEGVQGRTRSTQFLSLPPNCLGVRSCPFFFSSSLRTEIFPLLKSFLCNIPRSQLFQLLPSCWLASLGKGTVESLWSLLKGSPWPSNCHPLFFDTQAHWEAVCTGRSHTWLINSLTWEMLLNCWFQDPAPRPFKS